MFDLKIKNNDRRDADISIGMEAAEVAERQACQTIVDTIDDMCLNDEQRSIAAIVVSALILEKFESSKVAAGFEFGETVAQIQSKIRSGYSDRARKHAAEHGLDQPAPWWRRALETFSKHTVLSYFAIVGGTWMVIDLVDAAIKLAG
jgi:hypothetical protein